MFKKDKELSIALICFIICLIIISIDLIIKEKYIDLLIAGGFMLIFIGLIVFLLITESMMPKQMRKNKKHYLKIKNKENKTAYEKLYILAYQEKDEEIVKIIKSNKINALKEIGIYVLKENEINLYYRYRGFDCNLKVTEKKVTYLIDTPSRYDNLKENEIFEKEKKTNIDVNNIDYDTLIIELLEVIKKSKEEIDLFAEVTIVDEVFNGRLLRKIDRYKNISKEYGWLYVILGGLIVILMTFILVGGLRAENFFGDGFEKVIGISSFCLFICFGLFAFIAGLNYIITSYNVTKDYQNKRIKKIKECPNKVKFIYESGGRHSNCRYICGIRVYYKNIKLIIPFEYVESKKRNAKVKAFKESCLQINSEITYLEKSKIVIRGYDRYIRYANQYVFERDKY